MSNFDSYDKVRTKECGCKFKVCNTKKNEKHKILIAFMGIVFCICSNLRNEVKKKEKVPYSLFIEETKTEFIPLISFKIHN